MAPIAVGDTIPSGTFMYVPYTEALADPAACGLPGKMNTSEWAGKKVILVGVPGAFTPTCSANHIPPFLKNYDAIKAKGVDAVYVVSCNDMFVQSAWGRVLHTSDKIAFLSDTSLTWLAAAGLTQDLSHVGFGARASRFALVIDDLKVTYVGIEDGGSVGVSGADAVIAKL